MQQCPNSYQSINNLLLHISHSKIFIKRIEGVKVRVLNAIE